MPDDDALEDDASSAESPEPDGQREGKKGSPSADLDVRSRIRTLDDTEKRWGYAAAAILGFFALVSLVQLITGHHATYTLDPVKGKCTAGYHLTGGKCVLTEQVAKSRDLIQFGIFGLLGSGLALSVWKSRKTPAMVISFFAGLALSAASFLGFAYLGYGGWLLVRSWRIQRYGAPDGRTARQVSVKRAEAKRQARRQAKNAAPATPTASGRTRPTPSKRYTPKSKSRRK